MFLKSFTELALDFREVRAAMLLRPPRWLDGLADIASADGSRLLVDVGLEVGDRRLSRRAWLEVSDGIATDRVASLPLRLRVDDHPRLFPSLDGSLDAAWLGDGRTHLALAAQYEPPFGLVGMVVDRTLLHRVAEAVAQRFVESVASRLTTMAASGRGNHRAGAD
jgi:hypothetical protein